MIHKQAYKSLLNNFHIVVQVVLENSCRADEHDCPFAHASIELTNVLCDILKVGEYRKCFLKVN